MYKKLMPFHLKLTFSNQIHHF